MNRNEAAILQSDLSLAARNAHDHASLQAIAKHGPARYVVSGAISIRGGTMHVRARLQDAVAGTTLAVVERSGSSAHIAPITSQIASDLRDRAGLPPLTERDIDEASHVLPRGELVEAYVRAAHRSYRSDFPGVVEELEPVVAAQPDFAPARAVRMWAIAAIGDPNGAVEEIVTGQAHAAGLPARRRLEIDLFRNLKAMEWDETKALVGRALAERPGDTLLHCDLVSSLVNANRFDDASELLETLKRLSSPDGQLPCIDIADAQLAQAQRKFPEMAKAAHRGVERARQANARYALADSLELEGAALNMLLEPEEAIAALSESAELGRALGVVSVRPWFSLKDLYVSLGRLDDARRILDEIHELRMKAGTASPQLVTAMHVFDLGMLDQSAGNVSGALSRCVFARLLYIAAGEAPKPFGLGVGLGGGPPLCLAWARDAQLGARRPTVDAARARVDAARRDPSIDQVGPLESLGNALWDAGRYAEAEARFDELASMYDARGSHRRVGWAYTSIAELSIDAGDPARARTFAERAIVEFRQSKGELAEAYANHVIAMSYVAEGNVAAARAAIAPSEAYVATLQNLEFRIRMLGWEAVVKGDIALADQTVAEATAIDNYTTITRAKLMRAQVLQQLGRDVEAKTELADVIARARHLGHGEWERQAQRLLSRPRR